MILDLEGIRHSIYAQINLPALRFFHPKESFFALLKLHWPKQVIVDCGTGVGDLVVEAQTRDIKMIGIDPIVRDNQNLQVLPLDATVFDWKLNMVCLICRPSHDSWAYDTAVRARKMGIPVVYVGLNKNVGRDLGRLPRKVFATNVGDEGEKLWLLKPLVKRT